MNTSHPTFHAPNLLEFYERDVLPSLFQRLDQAFPEFKWTRVEGGWTASQNPFQHERFTSRGQICCRQPWGFVAEEGTTVSWLAYANGGRRPVEYEIVNAVRKLAQLAGIDDTAINRPFSSQEIRAAHKAERQQELLEAFAAYCHVVLNSQEGHSARVHLRRVYGLDWQQMVESPLGLYTSSADIHDYLASMGFSPDDIHESKVTRDVRLDGRILIPWRDACGQLRSFVACQVPDGRGDRSGRLFLKGRENQDAFGIDVALRPEAGGRDELILAESILDVVFLHSIGLSNVASFGTPGRAVSIEQWEQLADQGVARVTLAYEDDAKGRQRAFETICEANRARRCPELFVVPPDAFAAARGPATYTRLNGLGQFRSHLDRRIHAYHFVAEMLIRKHRPTGQWTDSALVEVLNEAIQFDAVTYQTERALALERFFWPHIVAATGADWDAIRNLLTRGGTKRRRTPTPLYLDSSFDYDRLLRDLSDCHYGKDFDAVQALICAAADAFRAGQQETPKVQEAPFSLDNVTPHRRRRRRRRPAPEPEFVEVPRIIPIKRPAAFRWPAPPAQPNPEPRREPPVKSSLPLDVPTLAYQLWEKKGRPDNAEHECWFEAEQLVAKALAELNRRQASSSHRDWKSAA